MFISVVRSKGFFTALFTLSLLSWSLEQVAPLFNAVPSAYAAAGDGTQISLSGGSTGSPLAVGEGDDYATSVLNSPWDMDAYDSLGWFQQFSSATLSGGIFTGVHGPVAGWVMPLYAGFDQSALHSKMPGDRTLPFHGRDFPIDSSKYKFLSYRSKSSDTDHVLQVLFKAGLTAGPIDFWPHQGFATSDKYLPSPRYDSGPPALFELADWKNRHFNLADPSKWFEQVYGTWSGDVVALMINGNASAKAGHSFSLDFVRLVDPDSGPQYTISWSSDGADYDHVVAIYYSIGSPGANKTFLAGETVNVPSGSYVIPTAMFPPGTYYFHVELLSRSDTKSVLATSGYSQPLVISAAPTGYVSSPTYTDGQDYFTNIGNPADMNEALDVPNANTSLWTQRWRQWTNGTFAGGVFSAKTEEPYANSENTTDAQVHAALSPSTPPSTSKYRYFLVDMKIDETPNPLLADFSAAGHVGRIVWWNDDFDTRGVTGDIVIRPGQNTYVIDLKEAHIDEGLPWTTHSVLRFFRFDPTEAHTPVWFNIADMQLRSEPTPAIDGNFTIKATVADTDSSSLSVSFYYDTDKSGYDGTLIGSLSGVAPGNVEYTWNTAGLTEGSRYYVYAVVSDGVNTSKFYSLLPVLIGLPAPDAQLNQNVVWKRNVATAYNNKKKPKTDRTACFTTTLKQGFAPSVKITLLSGAKKKQRTVGTYYAAYDVLKHNYKVCTGKLKAGKYTARFEVDGHPEFVPQSKSLTIK